MPAKYPEDWGPDLVFSGVTKLAWWSPKQLESTIVALLRIDAPKTLERWRSYGLDGYPRHWDYEPDNDEVAAAAAIITKIARGQLRAPHMDIPTWAPPTRC
jgi:hypothetical protein